MINSQFDELKFYLIGTCMKDSLNLTKANVNTILELADQLKIRYANEIYDHTLSGDGTRFSVSYFIQKGREFITNLE